MSVVAVKLTDRKISISADNQVSYRDNKIDDKDRGKHDAKIYKVGDIIFGTAGYTEVASMFRLYCETRKPEHNDEVGILNFLVEFATWAKEKDSDFKLINQFIIIFEKRVYVTHGYEVSEVETHTAIGSGMFLALGAMYMSATTEKAIEVAKRYDLYCGGETITHEIDIRE